MVIMQRNIESKVSTSNIIRQNDETERLEKELINARAWCKYLERDIQILISGRNNEATVLNRAIVSLENRLKVSEGLNPPLSGEIA